MKICQYYQFGRYDIKSLEQREKYFFPMRIKWIKRYLPEDFFGKILDVGCGEGIFLEIIKKNNPSVQAHGVDISEKACQLAEEKGVNAKVADLNLEIPFDDIFFDFIIAHEVIEHLIDPDKFLEQCNRVLKKGGYLIITTPNLVAWYNRTLFLFGILPIFSELSMRERKIGIGFLKHIIKNNQPVGHIRVFTAAALRDLMQIYGFKIEKIKGVAIPFNFPKIIRWIYDTLDSFFSLAPSLSSNLLIIAKKK